MADSGDSPPVELGGPTIDIVATVVAHALGEDEVDPDVGFFDLGASSVVVLTIVEQLRHRWEHLRMVDCFLYPTVTSLAAFLDSEM